ncbi:hypothetical protein KSF_061350 [Reticulibacter mediterranei]|uniref:Uncharacterized protein n=1 Tax=Reticulibacter mediterranei TaxID=2778369 RepID=A0A8J3ISN6_9CHLR|nr:hypothetical protein [Reticulibacter mediterranei]GHO96087.1 hypothetical protein KSF_061350 [Reticulibacter mediterranei]
MKQQATRLQSAMKKTATWIPKAAHTLWRKSTDLWHKLQPGPRKPKPARAVRHQSWIDRAVDGAFLFVTSLAFLVFLVASLPHVAYFFAAFEPQNADGTLSDWWWFVAYLIAGAINITEFLLSIKFARELRNATYGLPWYQKFLPILGCVLKFWPFILLISGFSWAANLQHAREFHSDMLWTAESVTVTIPFMPYIHTWGDLNPYIVSAFPILNIAYTLMFDSSRNQDHLHLQPETLKPVSEPSTALQPAPVSQPMTLTDFQAEMMKGFQAMQDANTQAMKEMQRESVKVMVETFHHLAGVKAPQQTGTPHLKAVGKKPTHIRKGGSNYEEPIRKLLQDHPTITATEAGRKVGCSHVTAGKILAGLRVTITEVKDESVPTERDTGSVTTPLQSESA